MKSRTALACAAAAALGFASPLLHAGDSARTVEVTADSILELASGSSELELLVAAVKAAGLVDALSGDGPFTVFAPRDAAFESLGDELRGLLGEERRGDLTRVLTFHVVPGRVTAADLATRRSLDSLSGQRIDVSFDGGTIRVNGAGIVTADIEASNGIVHVIDSVMMPETRTIPALATDIEGFSSLVAAVKAAGLAEALSGEGPFTVLAPTDEAFAALGSDTLTALLQPRNRDALKEVLLYHVVSGRAFASDVAGGAEPETLGGETVRFALSGGALTVNGARVAATDVEASNGVVHVIDRVLIPEGFTLGEQEVGLIGIYPAAPTADQREALGLERGEGIRISSLASTSGARDAGLRGGDVIIGINGERATSGMLDEAKAEAGIGGKIRLLIAREVEVEVQRDDH